MVKLYKQFVINFLQIRINPFLDKIVLWALVLLAIFLPLQTPILISLTSFFDSWQLSTISFLLVFWKETLVASLVLIFSFKIITEFLIQKFLQKNNTTLLQFIYNRRFIPFLIWIITFLLVLGLAFFVHQVPLLTFIYGFRYELWWLLFFAVSFAYFYPFFGNQNVVSKNPDNQLSINQKFDKIRLYLSVSILVGFLLSSFFSIISLIFNQTSFLLFLGYQSNMFANIPACHLIDFGFEGCRLSGGFATPIHYAGYLLLVLPVLWQIIEIKILSKYFGFGLIFLNLVFIFLSVSRFAIIALAVMAIFIFFQTLKKYFQKRILFSTIFNFIALISLFLPILVVIITVLVPDPIRFINQVPVPVLKPSSTSEHRRQTLANFDLFFENNRIFWLGVGLGYSGPGAEVQDTFNPQSSNPLVTKYGYIADSWFIKRERMVVAENWFLQTLVNGGVFYLFLYIILVVIAPVSLYQFNKAKQLNAFNSKLKFTDIVKHIIDFNFGWLALYGVIAGNIMLGLWANQSIVIYWTLVWLVLIDVKHLKDR